jgi:hypothetical protein
MTGLKPVEWHRRSRAPKDRYQVEACEGHQPTPAGGRAATAWRRAGRLAGRSSEVKPANQYSAGLTGRVVIAEQGPRLRGQAGHQHLLYTHAAFGFIP